MQENYTPAKKHTLSKLNKSLCWLLVLIMVVMFISYYLTTIMQVSLTNLSGETMKLNNENIELQNKLDNLMSYNNVEEQVRMTGKLDAARKVVEFDEVKINFDKRKIKKKGLNNYYRWSLGF